LTKLEYLEISFQFPNPRPKRIGRCLSPQTRTVLPVLTYLEFRGVSEYLEVLGARIDAPLLLQVRISFFNQLVFDIPQISRLIGHLELPRPSRLSLSFDPTRVTFMSSHWPQKRTDDADSLTWQILCKELDWQVSSLARIIGKISYFCSSVESLRIIYDVSLPGIRPDHLDPTLWLELFRSFTSVQSLEISKKLEPFIAAALQGLTGESAVRVLPALHSLSFVGYTSGSAAQQGIESFVAARQQSDHPVAVHRLNRWEEGNIW
jgi:hypothetical protein